MEGIFLGEERLALEKRRGIWRERVLTDYLDALLESRPDDTAIVAHREEDGSTRTLTYRELGDASVRIATALERMGIGCGDVVSFQLPNWWEFIAVHLACVRVGAVSNPLMPIFRHRELSFMLRHAESRVLIAPARFRGFDHAGLALQLGRELPRLEQVVLVGGDGEDTFERRMLGAAPETRFARGAALRPNDILQLLYTSGTTGEPKGAMHTSNTLIGTVHEFAGRMQLGPRDVVYMPSPLAHQLGFCYGMMMPLLLGIPVVLTDVWNPERAIQLIAARHATFTFAATPFLADLANFPGVEPSRVAPLRLFMSSGAPIPPAIVQAARERLGVTVSTCWGMTECASVTMTPPSGTKVLESDGAVLSGEEVRVVDEHGNEAPRGTEGTLKVRGAALFVGYLKRPEFYHVDAEGWFDTGDLARMDDEGYIRICGRKKDIVIRGGENIPVIEVESAIYRMPEVSEVAIVAMPDARLVERACCFVVPRNGALLTLARIQEHLAAEGLSKHFWPERLEVLREMPRTPTGKIQKFVLRQLASKLAAQGGEKAA